MQSINKYFNKKETELINCFEDQMLSIHNKREKLKRQMKQTNDTSRRHKKYVNNLKGQIVELKDIIENLKLERISEQMFYEEKFINEQNINTLNKDVLQVIRDLDFGGTDYLFVQETSYDNIKITTDIEETTTLLKEGWVRKIYKGKYNKTMATDEMVENCELIFDKDTMYFKKTNLCDIRTSNNDICDLRITLARDMGRTFENFDESYLIRDMCDFDIIEESILQRNLSVIRASVASIDDVNDNFINVAHCFSIEKRSLYNKSNINLSKVDLCTELYGRIEQLINKDKQEINWNDCLDLSDIENELICN